MIIEIEKEEIGTDRLRRMGLTYAFIYIVGKRKPPYIALRILHSSSAVRAYMEGYVPKHA